MKSRAPDAQGREGPKYLAIADAIELMSRRGAWRPEIACRRSETWPASGARLHHRRARLC